MGIYTVKISKNKKTIIALKANDNVCYDNYLWNQLGKVLEVLENDIESVDKLAKDIKEVTGCFNRTTLKKDASVNVTIDLDTMTINKPYFPVYKIDEVSQDMCGLTLVKKDEHYFAKYNCDEDEYEIEHVTFDQPELLTKDVVKIDEFKKIINFVNSVLVNDDCAFILNNSLVIRFQNA